MKFLVYYIHMKSFILTIIIFFGIIFGVNYLLAEQDTSVQEMISDQISKIFFDEGDINVSITQ